METRFLLRLRIKRFSTPPLQLRYASSKSNSLSQQANPIGDYYASILSTPSPNTASTPLSTTTPSHPSHPPSTASPSPTTTPSAFTTNPSTASSDPSILFSSRLSSPLERRNEIQKKSVLVAGVWVPPRPDEPDNCCMSGCVNCVWDRYRDELEEWAAAKREASAALKSEAAHASSKKKRRKKEATLGGKMENGEVAGTGLMVAEAEEGAEHTLTSMDDDGGGSEGNWGTGLSGQSWGGDEEELFSGVPVGIREFMKTEKRLKDMHARENGG